MKFVHASLPAAIAGVLLGGFAPVHAAPPPASMDSPPPVHERVPVERTPPQRMPVRRAAPQHAQTGDRAGAQQGSEPAQVPADAGRSTPPRTAAPVQRATMDPRQRNAHKREFNDLPPAERERVLRAYEYYQSLPEDRREALREQWRQQSPRNGARTREEPRPTPHLPIAPPDPGH